LQNINNYGSILQALATQDLLKETGADVEIVDYTRKDARAIMSIFEYMANDNLVIKIVKFMVLVPTKVRFFYVWKKFSKSYFKLTKNKYYGINDFNNFPIEADIYCTGSDQVWNSKWNKGILPEMFLGYAQQGKKRISFSASFGKEELNGDEYIATKDYISKYSNISVREMSAVNICKTLGRNDAILLLDPTLLQPADYWKALIRRRVEKSKYVLVYQLNNNKEFDLYAEKFARNKNLKLVRIGIRFDQLTKNGKVYPIPNIQDFLSLFYYANYIITDSFHGTAFSLNFNKKFVVIYPKEFSTRLSSVLELTKTNSHLVTDFENFNYGDLPIDYSTINKYLVKEREKAKRYLKEVVNIE
jgi:hypothetical protein